MPTKKIIAVLGATGAQGGGLVRAILADASGEFAARAITRDVNSEKARALAKLGAEVVAGDVDDEASLVRAFAGAHGAFCVTFFWAHFSPEKEYAEAGAMARAAKAAGVRHVVWSTLEDTRRWIPLSDSRMPTLKEKYKVPHFDAKGEANALFTAAGVPTTFFHTSFYWENLIYFGMGPRKGADGKLAFALPIGEKKFPSIAAEDIGRCALGVFRQGTSLVGRSVGVAGAHLTGHEMAAALGRALGQAVTFYPMPFDAYRKLGFPGADDLGNMFQFNHDCADDFCRLRNLEFSRAVNPVLQSFDAWLAVNQARIPIQ
ncbi:MAG: NmrA/HSCARG family protein [Verrucomicrobia bacterium]|nr:NmrA/HSCARG family protein [Verrucomicrobiota bacterium]